MESIQYRKLVYSREEREKNNSEARNQKPNSHLVSRESYLENWQIYIEICCISMMHRAQRRTGVSPVYQLINNYSL